MEQKTAVTCRHVLLSGTLYRLQSNKITQRAVEIPLVLAILIPVSRSAFLMPNFRYINRN